MYMKSKENVQGQTLWIWDVLYTVHKYFGDRIVVEGEVNDFFYEEL